MSTVEVRRLRPDDWVCYRDIRVRALADAPEAFASTLEREQQFAEDIWRQRLAASCTAAAFPIEAERDDAAPAVGIAVGILDDDGAQLVGMWVASSARGSGAADSLIEEVARWAAEEGHLTLGLWVVEGNTVAERVYARNRFVRSGRVQPVPERPTALEFEMIRLLDPPLRGQR